jgi:hypothetical protein
MFAWAGNATSPGGFHRIRRSGKPAHLPVELHAAKGALTITWSDALDGASVKPDAFAMKAWSLKRTAGYGSKHYDEREVSIAAAQLSADGRAVTLAIPSLTPTHCYELTVKLRAPAGTIIERVLHGTIHHLANP